MTKADLKTGQVKKPKNNTSVVLATNKKASFEYEFIHKFEAGLVLTGKLVKLLRARKVNIGGKFAVFQNNQVQIIALGTENYTENVTLLLNQKEKNKILGSLQVKGLSLVIIRIYTKGRWLKAEVAIAKGKKLYNKKQVIKNRDLDREIGRELKRGF